MALDIEAKLNRRITREIIALGDDIEKLESRARARLLDKFTEESDKVVTRLKKMEGAKA